MAQGESKRAGLPRTPAPQEDQSGQPLRAGARQAVLGLREFLLIRVVWALGEHLRNQCRAGTRETQSRGVSREGLMG